MYPRQSPTTHTEQLGNEVAVYDRARTEVHALNPTAARVWRQCDGATSPDVIAAALRVEMAIPEADEVVDLTLAELARLHLLELPVKSHGDRPATTRRWLLGRGVAAAMLPAIYSIVAPFPVEAQSSPTSAPAFTSASSASFTVGSPGTFAVTAIGSPTPAISRSGASLPAVVTFLDNGNGTGTLGGTPAAGTGGTYALTFTATNSGGSAVQSFTLTVNESPA